MTDWRKEFRRRRRLAVARCHDAIACQLECRHGICVFPFALSVAQCCSEQRSGSNVTLLGVDSIYRDRMNLMLW